jgi:ACS family tartrate transporter-like MFS transporter
MGLLGAVSMVANARHSDRTGERYWHVAVPFLLIAACYAAGGLSTNPWLAVPALALSVVSHTAMLGPMLAIPPIFLKGKSLAAGIAAINTIGMLGGFLGPYWMGIAKDWTGDYQRGLLTLSIPSLLAAVLMLLFRRALRRSELCRPVGR